MNTDIDNELKRALLESVNAFYKIIEDNNGSREWAIQLVLNSIGDIFPSDNEYLKGMYPLMAISEFEKLHDIIKVHSVIKSQIPGFMGFGKWNSSVGFGTVLREFLFELIMRTWKKSTSFTLLAKDGEMVTFDQDVFNTLFKEMMIFFRSDTIELQVIYPLENFKLIGDPIELEWGWRIQSVPSDYRTDIVIRRDGRRSSVPVNFGWIDYALVKECDFKRVLNSQESYEESEKLFEILENEKDRIISALRLVKPGGVMARAIVFKSTN